MNSLSSENLPSRDSLKEELLATIQLERPALFQGKAKYREKNFKTIYKIQSLAKLLNRFFPYDIQLDQYRGSTEGKAGDEELQSLLNGKWEILYSTNSGYSIGRIGPYLGNKVEQILDCSRGQYSNTVFFFNGWIQFTITSKFIPLRVRDYQTTYSSSIKTSPNEQEEAVYIPTYLPWKIVFDEFTIKIGRISLIRGRFPANKLVGIWKLFYIDSDIRIFYSRNEKKSEYSKDDNLYILRKIAD